MLVARVSINLNINPLIELGWLTAKHWKSRSPVQSTVWDWIVSKSSVISNDLVMFMLHSVREIPRSILPTTIVAGKKLEFVLYLIQSRETIRADCPEGIGRTKTS